MAGSAFIAHEVSTPDRRRCECVGSTRLITVGVAVYIEALTGAVENCAGAIQILEMTTGSIGSQINLH